MPTGTERAAVQQSLRTRRGPDVLNILLAIVSVAALLFYYSKQQLLLYGDADAHLNIARRVVDNRHPIESYGQLGTVWLPLQHIAMLPFVWVDTLWHSGVAGAIPGMVAFVLGGLGIFRLIEARASRFVAYSAVAVYALNPNLLYMQTTAMNEPIFLAFLIWSVVYLDELLRNAYPAAASDSGVRPASLSPMRAIQYCGITLAGGALTRYDGWFAACLLAPMLLWLYFVCLRKNEDRQRRRVLTKSVVEAMLLVALVPVYWLIYTWAVSGNALDFVNGPYSAKAIALRGTLHGAPPYPGQHHVLTAGLYFLKSAQLNLGPPAWGLVLLVLAVAGTVLAAVRARRYAILLLLWIPAAFYSLSIAYGSVPIYIPIWYPFSYYNVRYGLELLPVFAVFPVLLVHDVAERLVAPSLRTALGCAVLVLFGVSYVLDYAEGPITLREAQVNSRGREALEEGLASTLVQLPRSSTLLMYEAEHPDALRRAGIPLRHVISEAEHPDWEWALLDPAHRADFAVACAGDPVWSAVQQHRGQFDQVIAVAAPGEQGCAVYKPK